MKTGTSSACLGEGMDVLGRDHHEWRLRVQSVDDLWVLQRLIQPTMSVGMLGERFSKQAERKKMWIRLSVEHTEHQTFSDVLRVHGIIEEAPIDVGMHHTHVVGLRDDLTLTTARGFSKHDRDLLEESLLAAKQPQVALLVVEGD